MPDYRVTGTAHVDFTLVVSEETRESAEKSIREAVQELLDFGTIPTGSPVQYIDSFGVYDVQVTDVEE